ncbi:MAG: hypothetical protein NTW05_28585, partial [Pseudonocardiales bacterium]|nr:hypothetical protein [Pseudonocardiales bacterium]
LLLSWAGTDTRSIVTGSYDAVIRQRAEAIRDLGRPVLLRFRWEMDRPNLRTIVRDPEDFVAAWRHTRQIFTEVGALNAAWVWCPHVLGFVDPTRDARAYYPGDDEVDWLCADVYSEPSAGEALVPFGDLMDSFLEFAQLRTKPIIVAEYGVRSVAAPADRARWLRDAHAYVRAHPQVKALVYFSSSQVDRPGLDTTVTDPETLAAFRELAADPYFQVPVPPNEGS